MLTTSKKPSFSYARRMMILPLLAASVLLFAFKLTKDDNNETVFHANAPFTLVVDAGHGGSEAGAPGANNVVEKNINLSVAKKIQELASGYGITVKMTRTDDATVSQESRMSFIKEQHPDACISVHVNVTAEKQTNNKEVNVYITKNDVNSNYVQSRLLGSSLLQTVKNDFAVNDVLMQRRQQGIYIIDQNPYPSVILECGYMNNAASLKQLMDNAKVEQMARDILQGVVAYANADKSTAVTTSDTTGKIPLYIVDGKEISAEEMKKIDANNIESVSVLKDAASIKKYGEKGKNGVVLIVMKKKPAYVSAKTDSSYTIQPSDAVESKAIIYVDGKEISKEEVNKMPTDDLESVSILKGDEAVKKYGEKGKNGVVVIITKESSSSSNHSIIANTKAEDAKKYESTNQNGDADPAFTGGNEAWKRYLMQNLKVSVVDKGPAGRYTVVVSFMVDENGKISDVKATNDPGYGTAAEAVRVIQTSPDWIPAKRNGKPVSVETKQIITFQKV